jgi:hypothetical protein
MKRLITLTILFVGLIQFNASAQENHGRTANLGLGIGGYSGYYGYIGHPIPVFHFDYEFNVARNFTLAPFANFYSYSNRYNWNGNNYKYRETVIPIGAKGTFYFDELFNASSKWDFYAAGSLGFALVNRNWEAGYDGDTNYYRSGNNLFLDAHIGAEYHFSNRAGVFLDLSSGVSTIGLAFH